MLFFEAVPALALVFATFTLPIGLIGSAIVWQSTRETVRWTWWDGATLVAPFLTWSVGILVEPGRRTMGNVLTVEPLLLGCITPVGPLARYCLKKWCHVETLGLPISLAAGAIGGALLYLYMPVIPSPD